MEHEIYDIVVIGGGPAGMMAAINASHENNKVCLLERNSSLGHKLLLTGKERCNFTSSKDIRGIVEAFGEPRSRFLFSALTQFSNNDVIEFFENRGVEHVVERGDRVFPKNGNAISILNALETELHKKKVQVLVNFHVVRVLKKETHFRIVSEKGPVILTQKVIITTGGKSYPATGSTGDGYNFAKKLGHTVNPLTPSLVPLISKDKNIRALSGLTLKNINLRIYADDEKVMEVFGEMLFTHFGVSGPIILTISKKVYNLLKQGKKVKASIDLKPALDNEKLQRRIQREMETIGKKEYRTLLEDLLPKSLVPLFLTLTHIDTHRKIGSLTKKEKEKLVSILKDFYFKIDDVLPIESGIVTSGGVEVNEIDSKTMESKLVPGLYFAGEVIGIDGPTGGFNLQKAWSTGYVAGISAANKNS